jgi:hypothetical protein
MLKSKVLLDMKRSGYEEKKSTQEDSTQLLWQAFRYFHVRQCNLAAKL